MSDDDQKAVQYGREARAVLDNPAHARAFEQIEQVIVSQLAVFEIAAERGEYLRQLLASGRKYRSILERAIVDGKFSEASLKQDETARVTKLRTRTSPR